MKEYNLKSKNLIIYPLSEKIKDIQNSDELGDDVYFLIPWTVKLRKDNTILGELNFLDIPLNGEISFFFKTDDEYKVELLNLVLDLCFYSGKGISKVKLSLDNLPFTEDEIISQGFTKEGEYYTKKKKRTEFIPFMMIVGVVLGLVLGLIFHKVLWSLLTGTVIGLVFGIVFDLISNKKLKNTIY